MAGGSLALLLVDAVIWVATKSVSDKLWDFFSPSSFHGSLAWLCLIAFILGLFLFLGKGGRLANWIRTGSTRDR